MAGFIEWWRSLLPRFLACGAHRGCPALRPLCRDKRRSRKCDNGPCARLDYPDANLLYAESTLLIEGRLRRQSRWRSRAWRPATAACNRRLGRHGIRPPGTKTRPRGVSLHALRRTMPETEVRTRSRKSPRWSAERRASLRWGTRGASSGAPGVPAREVRSRPTGCRCIRASLGASTTPRLGGGGAEGHKPRAQRVAGTRRCVEWRARDGTLAGMNQAVRQPRSWRALRRTRSWRCCCAFCMVDYGYGACAGRARTGADAAAAATSSLAAPGAGRWRGRACGKSGGRACGMSRAQESSADSSDDGRSAAACSIARR
jgi:hypothetical protein